MVARPIAVLLLLVIVSLSLTACDPMLRQMIAVKGAAAADQSLEAAEWAMCYAATVGSIKRRYGKSQETADAWRAICAGAAGVDLIGPK